ncbi:putative ABC transporter ATP-binding protein YbhF [Aquicella siphonis]|uniref:Putative ABC transporter ATP-binding protein YbhF n=2 Tax=Aquicella siphonis TaxID=254247 RepID=A0A5E4PFF2_9COXI|nr:putative ABC transporter ATP-binding protein YbhF [Aquicella siphonis]
MSDEYIVDVKDLTKSFNGKLAVNHVSLNVRRGEIFGFLGPNGSGKTTTIRMLCGLMIPDSGTGQCFGYDILNDARKIKRLVGYVPQTFSLYKDLTVTENLEFIARVYEEQDYITRARDLMAELGLDQYRNVLAGRLSGGWKQRLSLAAALIHDPKLLLLDEPTAGVDPKARRDFWNYISQLTAKGITSLVSTHYMDEAERCNRLAYIVYGSLMAEGSIKDIIKHVGLITWSASGKNLTTLADTMREQKGVEQVIAWGNELRICGTDAGLMQQAVDSQPGFTWQHVGTSLEEVFIHLVNERAAQKENV